MIWMLLAADILLLLILVGIYNISDKLYHINKLQSIDHKLDRLNDIREPLRNLNDINGKLQQLTALDNKLYDINEKLKVMAQRPTRKRNTPNLPVEEH
jgi:hypothetical protein